MAETLHVVLGPAREQLVDATYGILGRTALRIDGQWDESWGPRRERAVLATLLLHVSRPVPIDTLVDWAWPDDTAPPRNRVSTFHTYAARIRRSLLRTGAPASLVGDNRTYCLEVDRSHIDYYLFRSLTAEARGQLRQQRAPQALELGLRAVSLWRGQALGDLQTDVAENWRRNVEADEWLSGNTTVIEALLATGEFGDALTRANELHADHPHELSLIELRLAALHGLARYGEVTASYFSARRRLLDNSDVQAAEHLRQFHDTLVDRQAPPSPVTGSSNSSIVVPRQLPHDPADFVGRAALLDALDAAASTSSGEPQSGVIVVDGPAGVGKTALVVRWAHRTRDQFPDGDFYINLNGFSEDAPIPHSTVVDDFLIALGHPPDGDMGRRSRELLLSRLFARKRALVVLDNARDTAHVKDLVPLLSGSLVVVTSRQRLSMLSTATGARRIRVEPMPEAEAVLLLSARLGRLGRHPSDSRTRIAQLCGGLPLLINVLAEHVATWSEEQLSVFAAQVDRRQLISDVGNAGDGAANAATFFAWSYRALAPRERRLFRLLGLHPGPDIGADLAGAYDGRTRDETIASLGALVGAHLLEQPDAFDRYRFHDLLKAFACVRAEADEPPDGRRAAEQRALTYYLASCANADQVLYPTRMAAPALPDSPAVHPTEFASRAPAKTWFDRERTNLTAVVRQAADQGYHDQVWRLVDTVATFCDRYGYYTDSRDLRELAAGSAAKAGLPEAEASTLAGLGMVHMILGDYTEARRCLDAALRFAEDSGNHRGQASTLHQLGRLEMARGNSAAAVVLYRRCLDLAQQSNDPEAQCWTHCRIGEALRILEQQDQALIHLHKAQWFAQLIKEDAAHARSLAEIGAVYRDQGNHPAAVAHCQEALRIAEAVPDTAIIAHVCIALSDINRADGDIEAAIGYAQRAVEVCQQTHNLIDEARAVDMLGDAHFGNGETTEAVRAWRAAADLYDKAGNLIGVSSTTGKIDNAPPGAPDLPLARTYTRPAREGHRSSVEGEERWPSVTEWSGG